MVELGLRTVYDSKSNFAPLETSYGTFPHLNRFFFRSLAVLSVLLMTTALPDDNTGKTTKAYDGLNKRQCPTSGEICFRVGGVIQCFPCTSATAPAHEVTEAEDNAEVA
uniref:Uncharacterized protein n=1 Tax=Kwoniella bestiolae CBS 10118 TaxID=1296100 RepID=A0A1B9G2X9_9TREE|nr:hypothetical protein I302_05193 [Kwoniella bestiolae CBS 10118]OCF25374.1 hypothetical protein I302_05193 [Kwoniella bestiolae CBS 10118]